MPGPRSKHTGDELLDAPYGCNRDDCTHLSFRTLYDLRTHYHNTHGNERLDPHSKKFRCTMPNCGRVYKNLAGIKYHVAAAQSSSEPHDTLSHRGRPAKIRTDSEQAEDGKMLTCPVIGCESQYRQISGLRYHIARHEPEITLEELQEMDPALAERVNGRGEAYAKSQLEAGKQRLLKGRRKGMGSPHYVIERDDRGKRATNTELYDDAGEDVATGAIPDDNDDNIHPDPDGEMQYGSLTTDELLAQALGETHGIPVPAHGETA